MQFCNCFFSFRIVLRKRKGGVVESRQYLGFFDRSYSGGCQGFVGVEVRGEFKY